MRKDVRLGLAVGGFLILVVLVYIVFFASSGKVATNTVAGGNSSPNPTPTPQTPDPEPSPLISTTQTPTAAATSTENTGSATVNISEPDPTTSPLATTTGSDALSGLSAGAVDTPLISPTTPAHNTESPSASGGALNWAQTLDHGTPVLSHSTTPNFSESAPLGPSSVIAPPPAGESDPAASSSSTGGSRTYIVKPGETFWTIAKAEYGNGAYFAHLVRANPKITPNRLKAGVTITIPDKSQVVPASAAPETTARSLDPAKEYRVQPGDSLHTISKKLYGNTSYVGKLYEINKNAIGPNPGVLKRNMVLQLPESRPASNDGLAGPVQ